jgi:cell division protein ZapA
MANVNIKFNNKEFLLSCEDGQEEHLEELSLHLNEKFDKLKSSLGNIGENKLLLITSITTMDEYFETKKKIEQKAKELNILTEKFKELKSLVYEYKEKKEKEINNLSEEQKKMKDQLNENRLEYEKVIEKAANQIENFLTKIDSENSLQ